MPNLDSVVVDNSKGLGTANGPSYNEDIDLLGNPEELVENEESIGEEEDEKDIKKIDEEKEDAEQEEIELEPVQIPFDRPSIKAINEKFPGFFKEFPQLKDAIFREARFTSYFPTVEDAKEAFEDNEAFTNLSDSTLAGDSAPLLDSIFKTDAKAGLAFSVSFLQNLYKKDSEAYSAAVTPLFENLFRQVYKSSSDENMKNSAINAASFLWGEDAESIVTGKKTLSKVIQISEDIKKEKEAKDNNISSAFRNSASTVSTTVEKSMYSIISKDFDPDEVFTKTVRGMLIKDIIARVDNQLRFDKAHIAVMGARWKRARANGYSKDDESKLVSAYLARAKSLIPSVREKVRLAALGKSVKAGATASDKPTRKEVNGGAVPRSNAAALDKRDYSKMTDREILDL